MIIIIIIVTQQNNEQRCSIRSASTLSYTYPCRVNYFKLQSTYCFAHKRTMFVRFYVLHYEVVVFLLNGISEWHLWMTQSSLCALSSLIHLFFQFIHPTNNNIWTSKKSIFLVEFFRSEPHFATYHLKTCADTFIFKVWISFCGYSFKISMWNVKFDE